MSRRPSFSSVAALTRRPMMSDPHAHSESSGAEGSSTESDDTVDAAFPSDLPSTTIRPEVTQTRPGVRGDSEARRPVRRGKRALTFWVNPEPHKQFKMLSVREERPGQDLLEEALNDLFAKYGMHRIAK
jgi:hypothetical protein